MPSDAVDSPAPPVQKKRGSMLKNVLIIGLGIVVVALSFIAAQPSDYRVVRKATIDAPPSTVFAQVNDFHNWNAWSPWAKLDPDAKNTFEGPATGEGAIFRWEGNDKVGAGDMTIKESRQNELIKMDLHFIKPFEDRALTEFAFKPDGEKTIVEWSMAGHKNFMSKAVCLFMNMDKMIGGDFEKGLASIKEIAEGTQPPSTSQPAETPAPETDSPATPKT